MTSLIMKRSLLLLLGGAFTLGAIGCGDDTPVDPPDDDVTVVTDTLIGSTGLKDVRVEPGPNKTIYLSGFYTINPGTSLTIPAGTIVKGLPQTTTGQHAAIVALRGDGVKASGQLIAIGTATEPIIFTSSLQAGARDRGNWGGIVLLGLSTVNLAGGTGDIEGTGGSYGWGGVISAAKSDDNSGTLKYVRVEYGGTPITPDNEINGVTFGAVGTGTTVEYIQAHMIADDGFEWFGGTVNGKHLVSSGNDDDAFDMDFGYSGNLQYLFALQDPALANRGFEIDNNNADNNAQPYTSATVANVTIVGAGIDKTPSGENNDGFYLRRGTRLKIWNAISTNFRWAMVVDGEATSANVQSGDLYVKNSILHGRSGAYGRSDTTKVASYTALAGGWNNILEDPQLGSIDFANPDPRPANPKAANVGAVPSNGYFDPVSFAGAFNPAASLWTSGWTNWLKK